MRFTDLDAVTIDAFGTLVGLIDPAPALQSALSEHGVERPLDAVGEAMRAEARYYRAHLLEARDEATLYDLRVRCTAVFLRELGVDLPPAGFMPDFIASLRFRVLPDVEQRLEWLRSHGLALAVVANWDLSLREHLDQLRLSRFFAVVEPSAEKPGPDGLLRALHALGVAPARALHIGDEPADEEAARGAGTRFRPAPLREAVQGLA